MGASRIVRPFLAVATALTFAGAFAMPAGADTPPGTTYSASAQSSALDLKVLGNGLTLGFSKADVLSAPQADAQGVGLLLPGIGNQGDQSQSATANGDSLGSPPPGTCGPLTLPDSVPLISLSTACSSALAAIQNALPSALSSAQVANVGINAGDILNQLPLSQITSQVQPLVDALKQVFTQLDTTGVDGNTLVSQLLSQINQDGELVRISLGPSSSESKAVDDPAGATTGIASAQGAVIDVLPRDALNLAPVIKIEVGASSNTITVDRSTGASTVHFEPSLVKITLADDIAAALPDSIPNPISVAPGQSFCIPLPAPLESCVSMASGSQSTLPDGTTHAEASAVSLQLLDGLPQGGVSLNLAKTVVEAIAIAPEAARAAPATPETPLAQTGSSTDAALVGGLLAIAMAAYLLVRPGRRREELEPR